MTVIEGPEIPVTSLSLGRGWPTAVREGEDVTARVIAEAREAVVDGSVARMAQAQEAEEAAPAPAPPDAAAATFDEGSGEAALAAVEGAEVDQLALGVELAALLGPDAGAAARRLARGRAPGRADCLRARASRWPNGSFATTEPPAAGAAARHLLRSTWWA